MTNDVSGFKANNDSEAVNGRRYSLINLLTACCVCVLLLFVGLASLAYYRLVDFQNALSNIASEAIPTIVTSGKIYSQVNELSYLTERLAHTSTQVSRRIAFQEIQLKAEALIESTQNQQESTNKAAYLPAMAMELKTLNQLIEQRLATQEKVDVQVSKMYHYLDSLHSNVSSASITSQFMLEGWALAASEIIAIAGQGLASNRLNEIRLLTKQLEQKFIDLQALSHEDDAKAQLSYQQRAQELQGIILGEDGLLPLKADQLRIIGRTTGHSNFVRNLILDYARLTEFETFEFNNQVVDESNRIQNQVTQQIKLMGVLSIIMLLLLFTAIYYIQQRVIKRLQALNQKVQAKLDGKDSPIKIEGNDEITDIDRSFGVFTQQIEQQKHSLQMLSLTDGLTGIANRRALDQRLQSEIGIAARKQWHSSILLMDVDYFKLYNDHYGHLKGDDCLNHIVSILNTCKQRDSDFIARYGGEEFIFILPDTTVNGAKKVAQYIQDTFSQAQIPHAANPDNSFVTISIGITHFSHESSISAETILQRADEALYKAKKNGKNQFRVYEAYITQAV